VFTAFLDANVLVPAALTDVLLRAAEKELYRPRWSQAVLDEAAGAVHRARPDLADSRVRARIREMNAQFPRALVLRYEHLIPEVDVPDPGDRHVVAAAATGHADVIVTRNLHDFPASALEPWDMEAVGPDAFLHDMLDLFPAAMAQVLVEQANDTRRPALGIDGVLRSLERAGVPGFVAAVRACVGGPSR